LNVPVEFTSPEQTQPLTINPGDPKKVDECLEICEKRAEIDALTVQALESGEEMGATLARLRK
jgi:hypothetical protein